jgi:hypothetical protein
MRVRRRVWSLAAAVAVLLVGEGQAGATPLGLILTPEPDINWAFGSVNYNAGTDTLTITGVSGTVNNMDAFNVVNQPISSGTLSLTANIDGSGTLLGGSFTVGGTIAAFGFNSGTLLTGSLAALGFPNGSAGALEFLCNATGGDAQSLYGSNCAMVVGIVNGFPGNWNSNFSASFSAPGDIGTVVPEPGSLALLGLGLVGMAWGGRRAR